jgi:hypothetical protein
MKPRILRGQLSMSRITYNCDLQQASGNVIPLGVIAELTLENVRALGLMARVQLEPDETAQVGELMREKLRTPFDLLKSQFDWAWESTESGHALAELSNRFTAALSVSTPEFSSVQEVVHSNAEIIDLALRELRARRDKEFDLLLATYWPEETEEEPELRLDLTMAG